jgi:hypothetical protein
VLPHGQDPKTIGVSQQVEFQADWLTLCPGDSIRTFEICY